MTSQFFRTSLGRAQQNIEEIKSGFTSMLLSAKVHLNENEWSGNWDSRKASSLFLAILLPERKRMYRKRGRGGRERGEKRRRTRDRSNTLELRVTRLKNGIATFWSCLRNGGNLVRSPKLTAATTITTTTATTTVPRTLKHTRANAFTISTFTLAKTNLVCWFEGTSWSICVSEWLSSLRF